MNICYKYIDILSFPTFHLIITKMSCFLYSLLDMTEDEAMTAIKNTYGDMPTFIIFREPNMINSFAPGYFDTKTKIELALYLDEKNIYRVKSVSRYDNNICLEESSKPMDFGDLPQHASSCLLLKLVKDTVIDNIKNRIVYNEPWKCGKDGHDSIKIAKELGYVEELLQKGFPHIEYYNIRSHSANPNIAKLFSGAISYRKNRLLYDIYSRMRIKQIDGEFKYEFIYGAKTFVFHKDLSLVTKEYIQEAFNDLVTINRMYESYKEDLNL